MPSEFSIQATFSRIAGGSIQPLGRTIGQVNIGMANFTERVFKSIGRHFVTLSCVASPPGSDDEKLHVYSGFLIEVSGLWLYVTAGHVLREIQEAITAEYKLSVWRLDDQTAGDQFGGVAIPIDFNLDRWIIVEDEDIGLDYAAMFLDDFYRRGFEAGNALPIGKDVWSDYVTEVDYWVVVGLPAETVDYDGDTIIRGRVVLVPLEPAEPPEMAGEAQNNKFYAKLADGYEDYVTNIKGMSGGPIVALKKCGQEWRYSVIGVQSGWYSNIRTISACPISSFGNEVETLVAEALELTDKFTQEAEGAS